MEEKLRQFFESNFNEAVTRIDTFRGQLSFYIRADYLLDIIKSLKEDSELRFIFLADICALDWLGDPEEEKGGRFEVIYNLYSISNKFRLFIKVRLPEESPVLDSVTSLWHSADWLEREVWDLMGIDFSGHPDLRKIVTPDDLDGHPLRKDFPLTYEVPRFSWNKNDPPEVIT